MKKTVIAVAALLSAGAALAQSSATIFGIVDSGVGRVQNAGSGHVTGVLAGGSSTSRMGFRGTEDLGGGMAAGFWLEGELQNDVGNAGGFNFLRRSTVSLSGRLGEIRLGRDFTTSYLSMNPFDVWHQRGFGMLETFGPSLGGAALSYQRISNAVGYFTPATLGGFYGSALYAFGEQQSNKTVAASAAGLSTSAANATTNKTGDYTGGRVGYANGALDIALAYGVFKDVVRTVGASSYADDYRIGNLAASYNLGFATPSMFLQQERMSGRGAVAGYGFDTYGIGVTVPLGAHALRAQYVRYDMKNSPNDIDKLAVGYVYNLSKRTWLYADIGLLKNKGTSAVTIGGVGNSAGTLPTPTPGGNSTGVAVGMRHAF
jgi:predicted porin